MEVKPDQPSAWEFKLDRIVRKLAALKAAVKDPRISKAGREIVARAIPMLAAVVRYRQNLPLPSC